MWKDEAFMDTHRKFRGLAFIMANKETAMRPSEGDIDRIYQRATDILRDKERKTWHSEIIGNNETVMGPSEGDIDRIYQRATDIERDKERKTCHSEIIGNKETGAFRQNIPERWIE